ncbi:catalase 1 [Mrakia frigida]|uniref:catalase 1 n=1 Tax=Mrakia frigida TaxID=29902 RepID=UPI003FCBFB89
MSAQTAMEGISSAAGTVYEAAKDVVRPNEKKRQLDAFTSEATSKDALTTYFGTKVQETDISLKAGERGPTLLEDFHNREKISAFDHERIPERVVHARGVGAHGTFKLHTPIPQYSKAEVLNDTSRSTPIFTRFSTVAGSRGSADTVRDVRGFAVRFYTEEGNWDIVGNNIPVFFIQDAIKFVDLIHAVKPEPDKEMPQAQSAHDNAWDFFGLRSESTHMFMWHTSDRGIPRSLRMMQGFGVNTFVLVNAEGVRSFVKFHWEPKLGTHSLVWDEALKLNGQDPDFHRRDLYDAIDAGSYPTWELGIQVIAEEDEDKFSFDVLDATKIWPEELVPVQYIGTMELNRNVDEYFTETEQVAFCTQHIVPGIDFSNDPLLQGRNFSYFDTQISRLGVNFSEVPINQPVCPVMSNNRDGALRRKIHKGKVNYHPNRFDAPHAVPEEQGGYAHSKAPVGGVKIKALGPKFADHYSQAQMFYNSMSPVEKIHQVSALQFELGKCEDESVQQRILDNLSNVDEELAIKVGEALSLTPAPATVPNAGHSSAFLSQVNGKRQTFTAEGRKVGLYVCEGFDVKAFLPVYAALKAAGVIPAVVGTRQKTKGSDGMLHKGDFTLETCRSTHFDAVMIFGGSGEYEKQLKLGRIIHVVREAYAHQKAISVQGQACKWLVETCLPGLFSSDAATSAADSNTENGVVFSPTLVGPKSISAFLGLIANHRVWDRDIESVAA